MFYRKIFALLLIMLSSFTIIAQDDDDLLVLEIGDSIAVTLDADETATFELALEIGQSAVLATEADVSRTVFVVDQDGNVMGGGNANANDRVSTPIRVVDYINTESSVYTLELTNTDEIAGEITLSIQVTPSFAIEIDDRLDLTDEMPILFELVFDGEAGQNIIVDTNSRDLLYLVERVDEDGITSSLLSSGTRVSRTTGVALDMDAIYRVVAENIVAANIEADTWIEVTEAETFTDRVDVPDMVQGDVPPVIFSYIVELEQSDALLVLFESAGAQIYVTDSDGNVLSDFGHAGVPHEIARLQMIAPETGTYTIHAYNPSMGNLFEGEYTLTTDTVDYTALDDDPATVTLNRENAQLFLAEVETGQTYTLTTTVDDGTRGGVRVTVVALTNGETLLVDDSARQASVSFSFDTSADGLVMIELEALNTLDAPMTVELQVDD